MDTFPQELIDAILEHVYYSHGAVDITTLTSCAVLCRSWSESAQRLLFRKVSLQGVHQGRAHLSFLIATDPLTERGRMLARHVRTLEVFVGDKAGMDLDDSDLVGIIGRTPKLYELTLRVTGFHQFSIGTMEKFRWLANEGDSSFEGAHATAYPIRIRALNLLSCGVQSPILYQLLSIWPSVEFLYIGVEIAAPVPNWLPKCKLYQLTLMRTPRFAIMTWLLSSSMDSLRIVSFRDAPGRELDPLIEQLGPRLRSLRLMNYSLRAASVLKRCPNLEEFVLVQLSTLFKLDNIAPTLEHLHCRNLPSEDQSLNSIIEVVEELPKLRIVTCDGRARDEERFEELERLCAHKGLELYVDETPFWVREDPVYVEKFPRRKSVANFALMN